MRRKNKRRKADNRLGKWDILELLTWIPEVLMLPVRLVIWLLRGIGRLIGSIFDAI
ncbi:hypothetical protein [Sediminibacillus dalangtanensis]|uniref:hypothetical protein n=1 Tax=Sediminibacillus dalangtanensis TaxID=2729421 RepID=UPI001AE0D597|nr:hypothetical protein [Sediminibacillus dalangtanensis]